MIANTLHPERRATMAGWTRAEIEAALDALIDEADAIVNASEAALTAQDYARAARIDRQADRLTVRLARVLNAETVD